MGGVLSFTGGSLAQVVDPAKRFTTQQILEHAWFQADLPDTQLANTLGALKAFNARRKLKASMQAVRSAVKIRMMMSSGFLRSASGAASVCATVPLLTCVCVHVRAELWVWGYHVLCRWVQPSASADAADPGFDDPESKVATPVAAAAAAAEALVGEEDAAGAAADVGTLGVESSDAANGEPVPTPVLNPMLTANHHAVAPADSSVASPSHVVNDVHTHVDTDTKADA